MIKIFTDWLCKNYFLHSLLSSQPFGRMDKTPFGRNIRKYLEIEIKSLVRIGYIFLNTL